MLTVGSLFAGIGGFDLGLERAGMRVIWQSEIDPYASAVLKKHWPHVPNHGDIRFIHAGNVERPDVLCGGFPCQDISVAGNGAGLAGERSGLWSEFLRLIRALRPRYVIVENVAALLGRGFERVLGDFAALGFDAEWSVVSACALGAPHVRERLWIVAYGDEVGRRRFGFVSKRFDDLATGFGTWETAPRGKWRDVERWIGQVVETEFGHTPPADRSGVVNGIPARLDRIGGCGNAIIPQIAEAIGRAIVEAEKPRKASG